MPDRIDKLTPEQEAQIPAWVERWIKIGLCTDPADRKESEHAIGECYRLSGLAQPKAFVWVQSPHVMAFAGPIAAHVIKEHAKGEGSAVRSAVDSAVRSAVYSAVDSAVDSAVHSAVYSAVYSAVDSAVHSAVRSAVRSAVYSAVDSAVRSAVHSAVDSAAHSVVYSAVYSAVDSAVHSAVHSAVRSAVHSAVHSDWNKYLGGQFWVSWQSWEGFYDEICGLNHCKIEHARAYRRAQASCCWWWPHSDFCIICDRPSKIIRDDQGRLHSDDGMVIQFRDNWGLYSQHGVTVPEKVVMNPGAITIEEIEAESNAEVRRIMLEKFGVGRYLQNTKAKVLDVDYEGAKQGAAPRALFSDSKNLKWMYCTDGSTERSYYLPVPDEVETCQQAHSAICGFDDRLIDVKS